MGDLAERRMTLAEFLVWDDGTDTRYEFLRGQPRAMAPASGRHGVIQRNAGRAIEARIGLTGPCRVVDQAGILLTVRGDERFYVPDLAVTCMPVCRLDRRADADRRGGLTVDRADRQGRQGAGLLRARERRRGLADPEPAAADAGLAAAGRAADRQPALRLGQES
ncbi:MAG: Uma2 family endonuclease [Geminicoccaceae bacterium]